MKKLLLFAVALLLVWILSAAGVLPFLSYKASWDEDVLLQNNHILQVHRTATFGPDEWGRSGDGPMNNQTITFVSNGNQIEWESNDKYPLTSIPRILDFSNEVPIIVLPVHDWAPCNKYGYPQEGLAAFKYTNNKWVRVALTELPKTLKVNLLGTTHAIHYWSEYKNRKIDHAAKLDLERNTGGAKQDESIMQASKLYSDMSDSCSHIRPPPNLELIATNKTNNTSEINPKTLIATLVSQSDDDESISQASFLQNKGAWQGPGYLSKTCAGNVKEISGLYKFSNTGGQSLIGFQLTLSDDKKIPFYKTNFANPAAPALPEIVSCGVNTIYIVKRLDVDNLMINRFALSGQLVDSIKIALPNMKDSKNWGELWDLKIENNSLTFSIGDYNYTQSAPLGGVLSNKKSFAVELN